VQDGITHVAFVHLSGQGGESCLKCGEAPMKAISQVQLILIVWAKEHQTS
jgi:hypothetical protein